MKRAKIISLCLASALLVSCSTAPSQESSSEQTTTASETAEETTEETTEETSEETEATTTEATTEFDPEDLEVMSFENNGPVLPFYYNGFDGCLLRTETSMYTLDIDENSRDGTLHITINDTDNEMTVTEDMFQVAEAYLVNHNGSTLLYAEISGMDDVRNIYVYSIDGDTAADVGSLGFMAFADTMTDPECFTLVENHANGAWAWPVTEFRVNDEGMPEALTGVWTFTDYSYTDIQEGFSRNVTGLIVTDGEVTSEEKVIEAGSPVTLLSTDNASYIDVADIDGDIVRVDCSDAVTIARAARGEYYNFTEDALSMMFS